MRLSYLFLRSRRAGWTAVYLAGITAFVAVLRWVLAQTGSGQGDPLTASGMPIVPMRVFVPMAAALIIGVATHGPFGEVERSASRPLPPIRLGYFLGLLLWGAATLALLAMTWEGDTLQVFLRNMAGFAGLGFLTAPVTGGRLSWAVPFTYGILAFWIGVLSTPVQWWAWPMQPVDNNLAAGIAVGLLAVGLAVASIFGARDTAGEAE